MNSRLSPADARLIKDSLYPVLDVNGPPLRVLVAGLDWGQNNGWDLEDSLDELAGLAETAGTQVVARATQRREKPDPATLFGRGKIAELIELRAERPYDLVVVDDDLSPVQQRNLDKQLSVPVVDRAGLIIAIFAQRARTREAHLQVELARLDYLLPRLSGAWTHLERQMGGIGGRGGPGETQIELDRRQLRDKIASLKREIARVRAHRGRRPNPGRGAAYDRAAARPEGARPAGPRGRQTERGQFGLGGGRGHRRHARPPLARRRSPAPGDRRRRRSEGTGT